jgi:alginate O-acetyltransferase complex protein AlgI
MNLFVDSGGIALINMLLPSSLEMPQIAKIALPLGISFYTFQGLSYVIDVYRRDAKATPDAFAFSCYLTMFPQLVAGPIVRYATIAEELRGRRLSFGRFSMGASRFIVGLAKKILIADTLARVADAAFGVPPGQLPALAAWAGAFAYTCQIYYDFSGYSDMAIGMGHMLGFTFLENFNYPYAAHSVRDFWRRWHISLSTWFRDYLFIPLGGSRRGTARTAANLVAVFALCGLWHGASWIFLAWGLYHGFFLAMERVFPDFTGRLPRFARHIYVAMVFVMGWVLFRADSFQHAWVYYKSLLGFYEGGVESNRVWLKLFAGDTYLAFIFGAIGAMPVIPWLKGRFEAVVSRSPVPAAFVLCACRALLLLALLLVCFMPLLGATFTPFIYFRF